MQKQFSGIRIVCSTNCTGIIRCPYAKNTDLDPYLHYIQNLSCVIGLNMEPKFENYKSSRGRHRRKSCGHELDKDFLDTSLKI